MEVEKILLRPLLTEKSSSLQTGTSGYKKYSFEIDRSANKLQVLQAIRSLFKVEPLSCNIMMVKGKKKRNLPVSKISFKRGYGKTSSWKKAIVTMPEGKAITALEITEGGGT